MFNYLVESGSHGRDLKRKGSFFIGTFFFYAVLLGGAGVGSIYAYNVQLDTQDEYELLSVMHFAAEPKKAEPAQPQPQPKRAATSDGGAKPQIATVKHLVFDQPLPGREVAPEGSRVAPRGMAVKIGPRDYIPPGGGIGGAEKGIASGVPTGPDKPIVIDVEEAPEVKPAPPPKPEPPKPQQGPVRVASSVLVGKALAKPAPPYPPIAKQARQQGTVAVQIVVDEQGRVVSAKAASGPPLLLLAAERAAYQARFTPTVLNGQSVKITGVITYNFVLQ